MELVVKREIRVSGGEPVEQRGSASRTRVCKVVGLLSSAFIEELMLDACASLPGLLSCRQQDSIRGPS
jgi:hypothetical protein